MSIAPPSKTAPCYYTYDRERSCGGVISYGEQKNKSSSGTQPENLTVNPPIEQNINQTSSDQIGFNDVLDIINPLQHLPIIGWAYRAVTGDTIKPVPAMIGGTIFGGGIGLLTSAVQEVLIDHNARQNQNHSVAQNPDPIDRLISKIMGPEEPVLASRDTKDNRSLQNITLAVSHYASFDREQTAGSIAVYG